MVYFIVFFCSFIKHTEHASFFFLSFFSFDNHVQTLVPLPPQRLQKTSWKGCCGLFDLFSGTGH